MIRVMIIRPRILFNASATRALASWRNLAREATIRNAVFGYMISFSIGGQLFACRFHISFKSTTPQSFCHGLPERENGGV